MALSSSINFYNVNFPRDLSHVTDVASMPNPLITFTDYKYIHLNFPIDINTNIENLINANYIRFNNGNRLIYAFIDDLQFINQNVTRVTFEVDSYKTYRSDIVYKPTFVEREHVDDDTIGTHTVPEGLEYGEYITTGAETNLINPNMVTAFFVNAYHDGSIWRNVTANYYDGLIAPYRIYYFSQGSPGSHPEIDVIAHFLNDYISDGKEDNILGVITLNKDLLGEATAEVEGIKYRVNDYDTPIVKNISYTLSNSTYEFDGYIPKNNKLYCYPYRVLKWHNNAGNARYLKPEAQQVVGKFDFEIRSSMHTLAPVVKANLKSSRAVSDSDEYMTLSNYPQLAWNSNAYASYLANNSGNIIAQAGGAVAGIALAPATGGVSLAATAGSLASLFGNVASLYDRSKQGSKAEGTLTAQTVNVGANKMTFTVQPQSIRGEYAQIIDNYFSMFGYKCNRVKVPATNSRALWNYVKTNGTTVTGNIPQRDKDKLNAAFNRGITIWHTGDIFNYGGNNNIV